MFVTISRNGVSYSAELRRIAELPVRGDGTAYDFSPLRTPNGTQTLRPVQAQAIGELLDNRGLFAPIPVGGGKTLISLLAARVWGATSAMLIVPASLREKTLADAERYREHWQIEVPRIVSYEKLSRVSAADVLDVVKPDMIILDECHRARNAKAAVTRRLKRYLRRCPETIVIAMSGTITNRSIHDYAHILEWCFHERSPLPRDFPTLQEWAFATDDGPFVLQPGALTEFMSEDEKKICSSSMHVGNARAMRTASRSAVRRRVSSTVGCLPPEEQAIGASLALSRWPIEGSPELSRTIAAVRRTWERPDGAPLADAFAVTDVLRTLAVGGYYRWRVPPPAVWAEARRAWCAFVRDTLGRSRTLDTELQVANAARAGLVADGPYHAWSAVREIFTPESEWVWLDRSVIDAVGRWLRGAPGIVWVESVAVGEELARQYQIPYFGQGGRAGERSILDWKKSCIASIRACGTGYNLQNFAHALVLEPPASGTAWEQMLGRLHRDGQEADEVRFDVLLWVEEQRKALLRATTDAEYIFETTGARQKLLYCDKAL